MTTKDDKNVPSQENPIPYQELQCPSQEKEYPYVKMQYPNETKESGDKGSCFMCQIHEALQQGEPEGSMPRPILTTADAESAMTTMLCCGASTYIAWRYRRTRVVRRFFTWLLGAYLLLMLAMVFFIVTVYML